MMCLRGALALLALVLCTGHAAAKTCSVESYGAKGDGVTLDTQAIQQAANNCTSNGTLTFTSGKTYLTGTIKITGSVTVVLPKNSTVISNGQVRSEVCPSWMCRCPLGQCLVQSLTGRPCRGAHIMQLSLIGTCSTSSIAMAALLMAGAPSTATQTSGSLAGKDLADQAQPVQACGPEGMTAHASRALGAALASSCRMLNYTVLPAARRSVTAAAKRTSRTSSTGRTRAAPIRWNAVRGWSALGNHPRCVLHGSCKP